MMVMSASDVMDVLDPVLGDAEELVKDAVLSNVTVGLAIAFNKIESNIRNYV